MRCFADISAINHENKARYSSIIVCITFAQYCMITKAARSPQLFEDPECLSGLLMFVGSTQTLDSVS